MALLTGADLAKLEARPHTAKVSVDFVTPTVVLEGTVPAGDDQYGITQLEYTGGVGTPGDVLDGMPAYIYNAADVLKGIVRVKSADATYLYLAENDAITFEATDHFEVMKIFLIWSKFQTADVSGDEPIFYKDYDVAYTDQNRYPPPVPILGPHVRTRYLEGAADIDVDWDASSSYSIDAGVTITGYSWVFEGGTPGSSAVAAPTISYDTPGTYLTTLTITDSNGKMAVAYRWVIVRDSVTDTQEVSHDVSLRGSFQEGGWEAAITTRGGPTLENLPDGSPIAVTIETGTTPLDFGRWPSEPDLYFCGWLQQDTINVQPGNFAVEFGAATADHIMSTMFSFDVFAFDVDTTPAGWLEIQNLTVREAGYYLLRWHSNLLELIDVWLPDDTTRTAGIDAPEGNLFDQLKNMFQRVRQLSTGCNNQGALYIAKDVQHMRAADRVTYDYNHQMQLDHHKAGVSWPRRHFDRLALLELQGVAWDGADPLPFFSRSPGTVPVHQGQVKEITGLAVADQADCDDLCGMFFSDANNYQTSITFTMAGNWLPALDVFPQAMVILPAGLTVRGWSVGSQWAVVRGIEFAVVDNGAPTTSWAVDVMVSEEGARPFYYPDPDDVVPYDPPYNPPYVPPYFPPLPPTPPAGTPARVHVATTNAGVWVTDDITAPSPSWSHVNTGLTGTQLNCIWIARDPVTPRERLYLNTGVEVLRNDDLDISGAWASKLTRAQLNTQYGWSDAYIYRLKPQICVPGRIWLFVKNRTSGVPSIAYLIHSDDYGQTWPLGNKVRQPCEGNFPDEWGVTQLTPSPHNWQHVWIAGMASISVFAKHGIMRAIEGSTQHPSALMYDQSTATNLPVGTLHVPYADNADEDRLYLINWGLTWCTHPHYPYYGSGEVYRADNGLWKTGTTRATTCIAGNREAVVDVTPSFAHPSNNPSLFGSYTEDKDRIWFIDVDNKVGLSNDGGDNWTQQTSLPYAMSCASGFPTNNGYFFAGRTLTVAAVPSNELIYVSDDGGVTWEDKTGDLFTLAKAYVAGGGTWTTGLRTIAPEY